MFNFLKDKFGKSRYKQISEARYDEGDDIVEGINTVNISILSDEEREKLKVKIVARLDKIEVERKVSDELSIMKYETEKARLINVLNKMNLERSLSSHMKEMAEKQEIAKNLNTMNKMKVSKQMQSEGWSCQQEDAGCKLVPETAPPSMKSMKESDDADEAVIAKVNKTHKSEVESRVMEDMMKLAREEEVAKLINKVNRLEVEDKLVRNIIDLDKDLMFDEMVSKIDSDETAFIDTLKLGKRN